MNLSIRHRPSFVLSPTHEPILFALARYRYLTQRQLRRRLYGAGSRSYPSERLRPLVAAGYVAEKRPPRPTRAGSTETVYFLTGKGRSHVERLGVEIPERFRPSEEEQRTYEHYAHALAIIDVFITIDLFTAGEPRLSVETMLPDRVLKGRPMSVQLANTDPFTGELQTKRTILIPDAYLLLHFDDGATARRFPILLELDRGTEGARIWREKIRAYLAAVNGPYQETFGQPSLTIAIVTPAGEPRVDQLLGWLEAELKRAGRQDDSELFLVSGIDPAVIDPQEFVCSPLWRSPLSQEPFPLLELPISA